jgi:hypothetical protein
MERILTLSKEGKALTYHIDISWNESWTGPKCDRWQARDLAIDPGTGSINSLSKRVSGPHGLSPK